MVVDDCIENVSKVFKHYTLNQKVTICKFLSYSSTFAYGEYKTLANGNNNIFPWFSETLITIILMHLDDCEEPLHYFPSEEFIEDLNYALAILQKNYVPPYSEEHIDKYKIYGLIGPLTVKQITYQRYSYTKFYRFNYIYNHDTDMQEFFKNKTRTNNYLIYAFLGEIPFALISHLGINRDTFSFAKYQLYVDIIFNMYKDRVYPLLCDPNKIRSSQANKCNVDDIRELLFSYKSISERPLMYLGDRLHCISPNSLDFACTEGLLLNITTSEDKILTHLGPVFEDYLYHIIEESNLYTIPDLSHRTKHYNYDGDKSPADAILKDNNTIVIFEAKARVYKRKILINDLESLSDEYKFVIDAVKQLLDYCAHLRSGLYDPFKDKSDKNKEVFLVLTKLFYVSVDRNVVINQVISDDKYKTFKQLLDTHLLIIDIDCLELFFLYKHDFIDALKRASSLNKLASFYTFRPICYPETRTRNFAKFMNTLKDFEQTQIYNVNLKKF